MQNIEVSAPFIPMRMAFNPTTRPCQALAVVALTLHIVPLIVQPDPQLPRRFLPHDWPGHAAGTVCGQLYWTVFDLAEEHLEQVLGQDPLRYQLLKPSALERFGGREGFTAL